MTPSSMLTSAFLLFAAAMPACAVAPDASTESVDLRKTPMRGLPPTFDVTVYRAHASTGKQPLVIFVPQFGTRIEEGWFRSQAEFFTDAGYVVAVPQLSDIYAANSRQVPFYNQSLGSDLVALTEPQAIEVLATVAQLSRADGPARVDHVVLGVGFGALVAARYAAFGPPDCKGLIMISAGFGSRRDLMPDQDDMTDAMRAFGQLAPKVSVPSLWLNAMSNRRIPDPTAKAVFASFQAGNAAARFDLMPALPGNSDALFSSDLAPPVWQPPVTRFLATVTPR